VPTARSLVARARIPLLVLLVGILVASLVGAAAGSSDDGLWSSRFGSGPEAAVRSLGDGAAATGWDGKQHSSFKTHAGKAAWWIDVPTDQRNGSKVRARFADLGFAPRSGVRLEYDVFIASERDLGLDFKLPGFASAPTSQSVWYASSGGSKPADSASVRLHARPAGHWGMTRPYLDVYAYAHAGGGRTFQDWGLSWRLAERLNATGRMRGDEFAVPIGRWFRVAVEAEMNSPGRQDGTLRVWLDGRKGVDLRDMEWVRAAPYQWTQTMFETFYNSGAHPRSTIRLADMTFRPVGGTAATEVAESDPPTSLPATVAPESDAPTPLPATVAPESDSSTSEPVTVAPESDAPTSEPRTTVASAPASPTPSVPAGAITFVGDWNGDGKATPGWFHEARWYLIDKPGGPVNSFFYGRRTDVPVVGDWNGSGQQTVGVRRGNRWFLRNANSGGAPHLDFFYGRRTDVPVVGDWNGSGQQTVGVRRGNRWFLRNANSGGAPQFAFSYGRSSDTPVVGDWNGSGQQTVGVRRGNRWFLRNANSGGAPQFAFSYGRSSDTPVVGDWNGSRQETIGVVRKGTWLLRNANSGGPNTLTYDLR
jgi:hypothetical protein